MLQLAKLRVIEMAPQPLTDYDSSTLMHTATIYFISKSIPLSQEDEATARFISYSFMIIIGESVPSLPIRKCF